MTKSEITERLAQRLRAARKAQDLSLDALAKLSGVSRSMLSAIERGESSPTVASLWNLTQALKVDFSGLLDGEARPDGPIVELMRADRTPVIASHGDGCRITILSPADAVSETEIYDIAFAPGGALRSEPHRADCVEHLTVLEGALRVAVEDASETLETGDTLRYRADRPHAIEAFGGAARAILVVKGA